MYNREFREINTPEKAYVLGLLFSDGCIYEDKTYYTSLILHEHDRYLLEMIIEKFPFFKLVKQTTETTWAAVCNQKQLVEDLKLQGLVCRKSNENRMKLRMPKLKEELIHHFIRGYFDGDGSVYKQKVGDIQFDLGGTCFYMIMDIMKVLYDNRISVHTTVRYTGEGLRTIDYYVIYSSSSKVSKKFAEYIYKDCGNFFMKRKYERLNYIPVYNRLPRLVCPICHGTNTVRQGIRQMKSKLMYRGKCKDCNKQFSIAAPLNSNIQSREDELLED